MKIEGLKVKTGAVLVSHRRTTSLVVARVSSSTPIRRVRLDQVMSSKIPTATRKIQCKSSEVQDNVETRHGPWEHVMAVLANSAVSSASKTALNTAAGLALSSSGRLTVMFLDDQGVEIDQSRVAMLREELESVGLKKVNVIEERIEPSSGLGSVAVGEAADTVAADLVVMSTQIVHEKHVDGNLLAEFVPSAVLLLP
eukprot:jgi/Picsp_1/4125/NSC_01634-R1_hypothetical protein SELMODRAFT_439384 [Selaginella moellendorffii]